MVCFLCSEGRMVASYFDLGSRIRVEVSSTWVVDLKVDHCLTSLDYPILLLQEHE